MNHFSNTTNLNQAFNKITEHWSPQVINTVNDQYVKIAKLKGSFVWHQHDNEDELFYIYQGQLLMQYENTSVTLNEGDLHLVPKNTLHNPIANEECWVVLIESMTTKHTGNVVHEKTKSIDEQLPN